MTIGHPAHGILLKRYVPRTDYAATKRFLGYLKDQGKFIELHSCGKNVQYVPMMLEMGIDMWTPQFGINDPDFLHETYGKEMSFAFPLMIGKDAKKKKSRKSVRDFVDHFGANGRDVLAHDGSMGPEMMPQEAIARDELYNYSPNYYNKLYGRN
jgi:hypothetical protein